MKKFAKVTAIIALICAVLGVILTGIGAVGGGARLVKTMATEGLLSFGPEDIDWIKEIGDIQISVGTDGSRIDFNHNYEILSDGSHSFQWIESEVNNLVLNLTAGDVDIVVGSFEEWQVSVKGVGEFQMYVEEGTLYVLGEQSGIIADVAEVEIKAPVGECLDSIQLTLGAGDLDAEELKATRTAIAAGAADIEIEDVSTESLEVSVGAGNVRVNSGYIGDLEVAVGMGAAEVNATIDGNIEGSVSMGELEITVRGSKKGDHNYKLSCAAGEVCIGDNSYAGVGNNQDINNGANTTYTLDCAMGRIAVDFR